MTSASNLTSIPDPWACIRQPLDRIRLSAAPFIPMPPSGELEPVDYGRRRYIVARDGIYVQARNRVLDVTLQVRAISDEPDARLPVGELRESVTRTYGDIPRDLLIEMQRQAQAASPLEWAAFVHWNPQEARYVLDVPQVVDRSQGHIISSTAPLDYEWLILNIHSHGRYDAFFSPQDNKSDQFGVYFASVLGRCGSAETIYAETRLVVDSFFYKLDWHPWAE